MTRVAHNSILLRATTAPVGHCSQYHRHRPQAAFTLVELLVAIGLLSILLYMLAYAFATSHKTFAMITAAVDAHQEARAVLDMLADELAAAQLVRYYDASTGTRVVGIFQATATTESETRSGQTLLLRRQTLTFTTTAFQAGNNPAGSGSTAPQLVEVRYEHRHPLSDTAGNDLRLAHSWERVLNKSIHWVPWATWDGNTSNTARFSTPEGAGFSVLFFGLRFFDSRANPPGWTGNGNWNTATDPKDYLPAAVEITLVVRPEQAPREYAMVRVVEIPAARQ